MDLKIVQSQIGSVVNAILQLLLAHLFYVFVYTLCD